MVIHHFRLSRLGGVYWNLSFTNQVWLCPASPSKLRLSYQFVRSAVLPAPLHSRAAAVWESRGLRGAAQPPAATNGLCKAARCLAIFAHAELHALQMPCPVPTVPAFPGIVTSTSGFP